MIGRAEQTRTGCALGHPWLDVRRLRADSPESTSPHSSTFDAHPGVRIVLGHLGENLPYGLWRLDNHNAWHGRRASGYRAKRDVADYFLANFLITTSGNFTTRTLLSAIMTIGSDRILFSTDWPFENVDHAATWFDSAAISETDRRKIGRDNARPRIPPRHVIRRKAVGSAGRFLR
ncbi:amidohydrolase family protein [Kutzneria kofuensis]|uniref:amidohydrolase family protein n=1 Tax=Kutzneria kofuensis TaxID=103725 RepID=UPI003371C344